MKLNYIEKGAIKYLLEERIKSLLKMKKEAKREGAILHWNSEMLLIQYKETLKKFD